MCTDYEGITYQNYGRRGRCGLSTLDIQDYTPESQTAIASRVTELLKVQNSTTYLYSTNKTPTELQTDHGPRKTNTGTAVQQEHQSAAKTRAVSKSCSAA